MSSDAMSGMTRRRSPWVLLATIAGVALTSSLGFWQLRRADDKQRLHDTIALREQMPPLGNAQWPCDERTWHEAEQRHAVLQGHWLHQHTLFLDNRAMQSRAGLVVVTPLQLDPPPGPSCPGRVVLVQRGWVPRDPYDRTKVPTFPHTPERVSVPVRLAPAPSHMMELAQVGPGERGRIRQNVDLPGLSREWGLAFLTGSAQQLEVETPLAAATPPLARFWWQPSVEVGKHQAYAAQWFAMAVIMVMLYVWFQWWRPSRPTTA